MGAIDKQTLRRTILAYRRLLEDHVVDRLSEQILKQVAAFVENRPALSTLHCFLPMKRNREVNTWPIVEFLNASGKKVIISSTDFDRGTMNHFQYEKGTQFEADKFGIPTPVNALPAEFGSVDCVLVPLVAADRTGGRIGYGGGYYDRLLGPSPDLLKVGLSLAPCLDKIPFLEPHDVHLDYCITPTETIDCKHG